MTSRFPLGTDGWRGIIADGCTFEAVRKVCSAAASVYSGLPEGDTRRVLIGHDTRFCSPEFARSAAEVFARAGISVLLADQPIPTPAVSYHVRRLGLAGGLVITASHNPAHYNGVKIKTRLGSSAPHDLYEAVERAMEETSHPPASSGCEASIEVVDLLSPYRDHLASQVRLDVIASSGLRVVADSMHGAAGNLLAEILSGRSARVVGLRTERDALFGGVNPEPIASNLEAASEAVLREECDLAVAQDGDADRLGVLDRRGRFVSPHRVLALLLLHAFRVRGLSGGIARTFSTSLLIDRVASALGAKLYETRIGFKYIAELMNRGDVAAGGEESGGYAFSFHLPERDGVFNALLLIESLASTGRDLDRALEDLAAEFGTFAYGRRDAYLPEPVVEDFLADVKNDPPGRVAGEPVTGVRDLDGVKYLLGDRGWLLHRLSGTEPMIRLYCEHEEESAVERILDEAESRLRTFAAKRGAVPADH